MKKNKQIKLVGHKMGKNPKQNLHRQLRGKK